MSPIPEAQLHDYIVYDRLTQRCIGVIPATTPAIACACDEFASREERDPGNWLEVSADNPEGRFEIYVATDTNWEPTDTTVCAMQHDEIQSRATLVCVMTMKREAITQDLALDETPIADEDDDDEGRITTYPELEAAHDERDLHGPSPEPPDDEEIHDGSDELLLTPPVPDEDYERVRHDLGDLPSELSPDHDIFDEPVLHALEGEAADLNGSANLHLELDDRHDLENDGGNDGDPAAAEELDAQRAVTDYSDGENHATA